LTERKEGQRRGNIRSTLRLIPDDGLGEMKTELWTSMVPPLSRYWICARDERHSSRNAFVAVG